MHKALLGQQLLLGFHMVLVRYTAIYRTYRRTLGLFMEAHALRAFVGHDIINLIADRRLGDIGIYLPAIGQDYFPVEGSAIAVAPFIGSFVYGVIGAFGFASPAIDALIGDDYGHGLNLF